MHPMKTAPSGSRRRSPGSWKSAAWTAPRKKTARPTPGCSWSNPRPSCNGASWSRPTAWPLWPSSSAWSTVRSTPSRTTSCGGLPPCDNRTIPPVRGRVDDRYAGPNAVGPSLAGRQQAVELMRQIRGALAAGQIDQAVTLCRQLDALRIPENAFAPGEDRPRLVFDDVHQAMRPQISSQRTASELHENPSGVIQAGGISQPNGGIQPLVYDPSQDNTRNVRQAVVQQAESIPSPSNQPASPPGVPPPSGSDAAQESPGYSLFHQGLSGLEGPRSRPRLAALPAGVGL